MCIRARNWAAFLPLSCRVAAWRDARLPSWFKTPSGSQARSPPLLLPPAKMKLQLSELLLGMRCRETGLLLPLHCSLDSSFSSSEPHTFCSEQTASWGDFSCIHLDLLFDFLFVFPSMLCCLSGNHLHISYLENQFGFAYISLIFIRCGSGKQIIL